MSHLIHLKAATSYSKSVLGSRPVHAGVTCTSQILADRRPYISVHNDANYAKPSVALPGNLI